MKSFGLHRFEKRIAFTSSILNATGQLRFEDVGRKSRQRYVRFDVEAPGASLAPLARFKYEEWYERDQTGWRLSRYHYDYLDQVRAGRLGYHWHRLNGREPVHHAHCEQPDHGPADPHYRFYEMDLLEAHEEFVRLYASEGAVDCSSLRPLVMAGFLEQYTGVSKEQAIAVLDQAKQGVLAQPA